MGYIALKPCRFAGINFKIDDIVPEALVHAGTSKTLVKMGILAPEGSTQVEQDLINLSVSSEEGEMPLSVTLDGLQAVVSVLSGKSADAESIIETMTDEDALILLHACDGRKSVKTAAEARAKSLSPEVGE